MFNATRIGDGNVALMLSFNESLIKLLEGTDLREATGYVVAFTGSMGLGKLQPANIALIAGGDIASMKLIQQELGRTIDQGVEQYKAAVDPRSTIEYWEGAPVGEIPTAILARIVEQRDYEAQVTDDGARQQEDAPGYYDDYYREDYAVSERDRMAPPSFLETLAGRMGLRVEPGLDGGIALRCPDYPNCACGGQPA